MALRLPPRTILVFLLFVALLSSTAPVTSASELEDSSVTYFVALDLVSSEANSGCDAPFVGTGDEGEVWSDDPDAAIQAAINAADSGDIIHICSGTWRLDSFGDRSVNTDDQLNTNGKVLTIQGNGARRTVLKSESYGRIISTSVEGGAVEQEITIRDIKLTGGSVEWDGGAVVADGVTCEDSVISDNSAASWDAGSGSGGAIFSFGPVLLDGCTLNGNSADGSGGALSMLGNELTIRNSQFSENSAAGLDLERELGLGYGMGGAIYRESSTATVEITNSYFTSNESANTGGAVSTRGASESSVTNAQFEGNHSDTWGGALDFNGEWTLERVVMRQNTADWGGGAIDNSGGGYDVLVITSSQFIGNTSTGVGGEGGGAILNNGGGVFVTDSVFQGNTIGNFSRGGAILSYGADVRASRFIGNIAMEGGAIHSTGSGEYGGVISNSNLYSGNSLWEDPYGSVRGGAIFTIGVESSNDTFRSNSAGSCGAVSADVGAIRSAAFTGNSADGYGGAVCISNATIANSSFISNFAPSAGALNGTDLVIVRSQFSSNRATRFDGGAATLGGTIRLIDSIFKRNTAGRHGGAIGIQGYQPSAASVISRNQFFGNSARVSGGAIDIGTCVAGPRTLGSVIARANRFVANRTRQDRRTPDISVRAGFNVCE